jgi:hypothetical protein
VAKIAAAFSLAMLLLCGIRLGWAELEPKRIALVIGNTDYQYVTALTNPRNDARLIAESLKAAGFTIVKGGAQLDLDTDGMRDALRAFGRLLNTNTVAVFYYSGHGIEYQGQNYLVPIDANPTSAAEIDLDLVSVDVLLHQVETTRNGMTIIVLDACRTNPFTKGLKDISGGLAQMQAPRGTLVAFATQPGHSALDGKTENSPYARALAQEIRKPGVDVFNTFNEIARQVDDETLHQQTPWFSSSPIAGQFYFSQPVASQIVASTASPPIAPAMPQSVPAAPIVDPSAVTSLLQASLQRVGCLTGAASGSWDHASTEALRQFNQNAKTSFDPRVPNLDAMKAVSERATRVCPLACPSGETAVGDHCIATQAIHSQPASKQSSRAPAATQGNHCESWGGQTYCE